MAFKQNVQLPPNRRQVPRLDFDEQIVADDIYDESIDLQFQLIARSRIPQFQRGMQRLFVLDADSF